MQAKKIGHAIFEQNQLSKTLRKHITKQVRYTLEDQDQWWICHGEYVDQAWNIIFSHMKEAHPYQIQLGRNLKPNIIKDICQTKFVCLKALCFGKNNIVNIEAICNINAPLLQWLSFQQNLISSIKPLRKSFFPNLKILNLKFNKLNQIDLTCLNAPNLTKLCLQLSSQEPKQGEFINWAFKLQTTRLHILRCRNRQRISNSLIEKQLKQKYLSVEYKRFIPLEEQNQSQSDH